MDKRKILKKLVCFIPSKKMRNRLRDKWHLKSLPFTHYGSRFIYDSETSARLIKETLLSDKPCSITRFGRTELKAVANFYPSLNLPDAHFSAHVKGRMSSQAGFFPATDEMMTRFACDCIDLLPRIDVIGVWNFYDDFECRLLNEFSPQSKLIDFDALINDFVFVDDPWTQCLAGKKVLVIHPFVKTIQQQYARREKLFKNPKVLPEFTLKTIKAVQGLGDSADKAKFNSWFDALDFMCRQIDETDFDVALIGAGAYGMFLADYVKRKGKKAVHLGGALQILFGIKGKRWDKGGYKDGRIYEKDVYNEYWVSPLPEETPKKMESFVKGEGNLAYW